jgi:hypothetical protein
MLHYLSHCSGISSLAAVMHSTRSYAEGSPAQSPFVARGSKPINASPSSSASRGSESVQQSTAGELGAAELADAAAPPMPLLESAPDDSFDVTSDAAAVDAPLPGKRVRQPTSVGSSIIGDAESSSAATKKKR